tara:strand:+ start:17940 stop:18113 length:174 start_codon:yes stop_codon:yes gene_type:complete
LVSTHFHGDHSGGNENMTKAGAIIIAHDKVKNVLKQYNAMEALKQNKQYLLLHLIIN